ncbi:MAG: aspartate aminotransferase family protein [Deltaproteobacteria bacterium]|nr:aspartate aminotransferase family protein [Deltaproteobacteria bacterium]
MTKLWRKADKEALNKMAIDHYIASVVPKDEMKKNGAWFLTKAEGNTITDINGRQYLDGVGGGTLAMGIGYGREEIVKAMCEQAMQMHYIAPYSALTPVTAQLAAKLAEITPGTLGATFFTGSGSESVEAAIKLAKQYHFYNKERKRYKFISRQHAYHGTTMGALSLTGTGEVYDFLRFMSEPYLMPGVSHITAPYCYRCDLGLEYPGCEVACAQALKKEIEAQDPETVCAFIGEPVMGGGGCVPPVPEYWPMIRSICDQYGVLLIVDEVVCAFGRTGKMFGCEHWDLEPDIMAMAKNLTGCYFAMGATIIKSELADKMPRFVHVHTFSGHPVGCAAGMATIDIIEKEGLVDNAAEVGAYLLEGLQGLADHPIVGDVRGMGMLIGIELVQDKKTKARFPKKTMIAENVKTKALDHGVFIRSGGGDVIELAPVLTITKKDADTMVDAIDRSLTEVEQEV